MELFDVIEVKWAAHVKLVFEGDPLLQLDEEYQCEVLNSGIQLDIEATSDDGLTHHLKVGVIGALKSGGFTLGFELVVIEVLDPEIEAIGDLDLTSAFILHGLKVDDVVLLVMG